MTQYPLGRHQVHDDASRAYALEAVALPTKTVLHERHIDIFDQGDLGCCTAAAALGMLSTGPTNIDKVFTLDDVHAFYHDETLIDDRAIPGHWPPDDTGSAGLFACKVAKNRGWVSAYRHGFALTTTLGWVARQPVAIGIPWLDSMFTPEATGLVPVDRRSAVAGGHEVCLDGIDPHHSRVRFANSWGTGWADHGWGWLTYADLGWLLHQGGDAVTVTLA